MHEPLLAKAANPAPTIVLGLLLKPFSLGHELLLIERGNPLAEGRIGKPQDVSEAVLICSQSWEENQRMLFDPLLSLKLWIWRYRTRNANAARELVAFLDYRDSGTLEFPLSQVTHTDRGNGGRVAGAPFLLRVQQFLMTQFRMSETDAWDYPNGLAKMRWATFWEQEGGLEIYNAHEAEFDRYIAEQEAKGREQCQA